MKYNNVSLIRHDMKTKIAQFFIVTLYSFFIPQQFIYLMENGFFPRRREISSRFQFLSTSS
jgi:hypothetical protein